MLNAMQTTIDAAGRIVVPKALRQELGLGPGVPIEITSDGVGVRIEPVASGGELIEVNGNLVIRSRSGRAVTDDEIAALRDADRR